MNQLFTPVGIGRSVENHLAAAPMTRSRANTDGSPAPFMAAYYSQRAAMGPSAPMNEVLSECKGGSDHD